MFAHLHSLSLTGGGYKPSFAQGTTKRRWKYTKGEAKKNQEDDSFAVGLLPRLGNVCLIKDLSAWAELSCNLSAVLNPLVPCSKFLLQPDKNQGREINWLDTLMQSCKLQHVGQIHSIASFPIAHKLRLVFAFLNGFKKKIKDFVTCEYYIQFKAQHPWSRHQQHINK